MITYQACSRCHRAIPEHDGRCILCEEQSEGVGFIGTYDVHGVKGQTVQKRDVLDAISSRAYDLSRDNDYLQAKHLHLLRLWLEGVL